ncbi:hypothetical protein [Novosphingobium sp. M1R2S20]|uniref:TetR family transcriptional regulator n=1 Tax=Novosphingobium rhizovicinum TaxID=3228928 RepID=A0ABV3RBL5_9SPHN
MLGKNKKRTHTHTQTPRYRASGMPRARCFTKRVLPDVSGGDSRAGGSQSATVYLYFRSKEKMLFDPVRQDLAFQFDQYALLTALKRVSLPSSRNWLATFRDELDKRKVSLSLFWTGSMMAGYMTEAVECHRDGIIPKLGARFAGFDLPALGRDDREIQRAECYMMIFIIEGVATNCHEKSARPNLKIGIDLTARMLLHFLDRGEPAAR